MNQSHWIYLPAIAFLSCHPIFRFLYTSFALQYLLDSLRHEAIIARFMQPTDDAFDELVEQRDKAAWTLLLLILQCPKAIPLSDACQQCLVSISPEENASEDEEDLEAEADALFSDFQNFHTRLREVQAELIRPYPTPPPTGLTPLCLPNLLKL